MSKAFLIWILQFYGGLNSNKYITEGTDDMSCDLIFPYGKKDKTYYVVQAKYYEEKNSRNPIQESAVKTTISDFRSLLLTDEPSGENRKFLAQFSVLRKHIEENGKVVFLFIGMGQSSEKVSNQIKNFNNSVSGNFEMRLMDLSNIKRDFIEFEVKGVKAPNRLEYWEHELSPQIDLPVEQSGDRSGLGSFLKVEKPFEGIILLIKPKTIFHLFERYGFSLFAGNVRNPLPGSLVNNQIIQTLKNRPTSFWYFNNGITAITNHLPRINVGAKKITIKGFQVINGAQTFYSIFEAYRDASSEEREIINEKTKVTLRLINSSEKEFNLEISRYTNSQNTIFERDFHSNDSTQHRLQIESFKTDFWYEKRRGEFRKERIPKGVNVVSNERLAMSFLVFFLDNPTDAVYDLDMPEHGKILFKSRKEHPRGKLEDIFDSEYSSFDSFLVAWRWFEKTKKNLIAKIPVKVLGEVVFDKLTIVILPILKLLLDRYYREFKKIENDQYIRSELAKMSQENPENNRLVKRLLSFILETAFDFLLKDKEELTQSLQDVNKVFYSEETLNSLKEEFMDEPINWEKYDGFNEKTSIQKKSIEVEE